MHLLGILLAEIGSLCADELEQDRDHGGDAIEVARAAPRPPAAAAIAPTETVVSKPGG